MDPVIGCDLNNLDLIMGFLAPLVRFFLSDGDQCLGWVSDRVP